MERGNVSKIFPDTDFELACQELDNPHIDGWEFFTESHGITIYRLYNEQSGLYEYKIYGTLDDVLPDVCAQVYMDLEYRKTWDTYVYELYETQTDDKKVIYWNVKYPWPMSNRDIDIKVHNLPKATVTRRKSKYISASLNTFGIYQYVYIREMREMEYNGKKIWVVKARSEMVHSIPERDGVIRVDDYKQSCVLTTDGKVGSRAYMHYYDNPKGSIPTWLINWAAKTGVPGFLTIMQKACRGYPDYLRSKQQATGSS